MRSAWSVAIAGAAGAALLIWRLNKPKGRIFDRIRRTDDVYNDEEVELRGINPPACRTGRTAPPSLMKPPPAEPRIIKEKAVGLRHRARTPFARSTRRNPAALCREGPRHTRRQTEVSGNR